MKSSTYHVFFSNLSNPLRVSIILCLREKDMCVGELSKFLKVEQSKVSHALTALKGCSIVRVERKGKERIYSLNKNTILPMLKLIDNHASIHCDCTTCKKSCEAKK